MRAQRAEPTAAGLDDRRRLSFSAVDGERPRLDRLLRPDSIAIIGASANDDAIGGRPVRLLREHGFAGRLYAVNPNHDQVQGLRAYPAIDAVPEPVDLAIVAVPAVAVPDVVAACAAAGAGAALVFSSGFAEGAGSGAGLQAELVAAAARTGLRLAGPNSEGFLNVHGRVAAGFSPTIDPRRGLRRLIPGDVAVVSQSGGMGFALLNAGLGRGLGFSYVVSTGNEADLDSLDFLEFLLEDERSRVVLLFVEGFRHARRFPALAARAAALGKAIVVAKVGRSPAGRRAALSHTAHLAGRDAAYDAVFRRWGVTRAADEEEAVDLALALSRAPLPGGRRVAVVTVSGGSGVWMADALAAEGLEVPVLSDDLQARIRRLIPSYGAAGNPVDVTAQVINTAGGATPVLELVLASDEIDLVVFVANLASPESLSREGDRLRSLAATSPKPILVYGYAPAAPRSTEHLADLGLAWFPSSRRTARAARALVEHAAGRRRAAADGGRPAEPATSAAREPVFAPGETALDQHRARALLGRWGLPTPEGAVARSPDEAAAIAERLGCPVAVKAQAAGLLHKSDVGGVALGLGAAGEVRRAALAMATRAAAGGVAVEGFLVQRMAPPGIEMILGALDDADFCPLVMAGVGGIHAEVLADRAFAPAPVSSDEAADLIGRLRGARLLAGHRGRPPADVAALSAALSRLSRLAVAHAGEIGEIDLNPVIVHSAGHGVTVVDAVVLRLQRP
jgi:acetate---CoA ligase (ADP-forming)